MRIGYGRLGRPISLDAEKTGFQGNAEAPNLLMRLARRNPSHAFVVIGHSFNDRELDLPPNVEVPMLGMTCQDMTYPTSAEYLPNQPEGLEWTQVKPEALERDREMTRIISQLDGAIMHISDHGPSRRIPQVEVTWAQAEADPSLFVKPYNQYLNYSRFVVEGLNDMGDRTNGRAPIVWMAADPRNHLKERSIKWPTGCDAMIAQYAFTREQRHERYRDARSPASLGFGDTCRVERNGELWVAQHRYVHEDMELMALPDDWATWGDNDWDSRSPAGIATTSFAVGLPRRSELVRDWLLSHTWGNAATPVMGKWDDASLEDVPPGTVEKNDPRDFQKLLESWRVTLALPMATTGWTVAKPYQCFAARVACFFVGPVDDQGWMLPTRRRCRHRVGDGLYSSRRDWTADDAWLASILRVEVPQEFHERAERLCRDRGLWESVVAAQRALLSRRWGQARILEAVERRLGIAT